MGTTNFINESQYCITFQILATCKFRRCVGDRMANYERGAIYTSCIHLFNLRQLQYQSKISKLVSVLDGLLLPVFASFGYSLQQAAEVFYTSSCAALFSSLRGIMRRLIASGVSKHSITSEECADARDQLNSAMIISSGFLASPYQDQLKSCCGVMLKAGLNIRWPRKAL